MAGTVTRPPAEPGPPGVRSRSRLVWVLLALALALVLAVVVALVLRPGAPPHPSRAANPTSYPTPSDSYAVDCLAVGAAVSGGETDVARFERSQQQLGTLTIRRSFDPSLPSSFRTSAAAGDQAAGLHSFVSWKPPNGDHAGAAAGRYDKQIAGWARSVPHTGVFATAWHEPENDMTADQYVAFERHVYTVVKKANPTIRFGPVYMAFRWDPTQTGHFVGDPTAWWPGDGYADFAGLDWYGPDPQPMTTSNSFQLWYKSMYPTGVPLYITEYGQGVQRRGAGDDPGKDAARASAIRADASWIAAHPRIRMWMYWQSTGAQGDWRLKDPASQAAWRAVADSGCRS
jgi:hypothetical protein